MPRSRRGQKRFHGKHAIAFNPNENSHHWLRHCRTTGQFLLGLRENGRKEERKEGAFRSGGGGGEFADRGV